VTATAGHRFHRPGSRTAPATVKSVIRLACDLHIGVVAEGVETADQLEYLRRFSYDEVQGHLISWPGSAMAFWRCCA
jgi:EAL domain-containing protein (putative c-di-GMP-specific phosphodiesterase class I)